MLKQLGSSFRPFDPPGPVAEIDEHGHGRQAPRPRLLLEDLAQISQTAVDVTGGDPRDASELVEHRAGQGVPDVLDDRLDALAESEALLGSLGHHQHARGAGIREGERWSRRLALERLDRPFLHFL